MVKEELCKCCTRRLLSIHPPGAIKRNASIWLNLLSSYILTLFCHKTRCRALKCLHRVHIYEVLTMKPPNKIKNVVIGQLDRAHCPLLCVRVQSACDWGCCLSSCPLWELIWPETLASLGVQCDVMQADTTSWRPSPCWWSALWRILVLYLISCSYPNITLPFSDRG